MSGDSAFDVKLVAFWPKASGDGVVSIAIRFGPSLPKPFAVRLTSDAEPRLRALAGYSGFALVRETPAEDPLAAPEVLRLAHLRRAPAAAHAEGRQS